MRYRTRIALVAAASLFTVTGVHASAGVAEDFKSGGTAPLKWVTREPIKGPTSQKIGASALMVEVGADLDPVADPVKPLLSVDMPTGAVVEAQWSTAEYIDLVLVDGLSRNATFKIEHTLAPHMKLYVDFGPFKTDYDYNAAGLIDKVPGSNWNYVGLGQETFDPWGFKGVPVTLKGPALDDAQLFSIPLPSPGGNQPVLEGTMALNATTSPTFNYKTTLVTLSNGTPINASGGVWRIPTTDANFLDVSVLAKGEITYTGTLDMRPSITINKIGDLPTGGLTLEIDQAGVKLPFESGLRDAIPVEFPQTIVHIPLPNVKAEKVLNLGDVAIGESASQQGEIQNTGEMKATMTFESSDPQFTVTGGNQIIEPKDKYLLAVKFTPTVSGPQTAEIKVKSNDPNEPIQIIRVTGNGGDADGGGRADSGCGCKTAPASSDVPGIAGVGLALAAILRRRRRA